MNGYNNGRMIQSFNGYCYTCYGFGHKANQYKFRVNERILLRRISHVTVVVDLDILPSFAEVEMQERIIQ